MSTFFQNLWLNIELFFLWLWTYLTTCCSKNKRAADLPSFTNSPAPPGKVLNLNTMQSKRIFVSTKYMSVPMDV